MMTLAFSINVRADTSAVSITKGQPAPFDGVVMTTDKATSVKNELIDKDACLKSVDVYKSNQSLLSQQVTILLNQNNLLIQEKASDVKKDEFNKYLLFFSGVAVTSAAVYLASRLTRNP